MLPRYARRTRDVDDALLACYLAGANSRRIRTALKPLLGETHLSKSAVSRVVARLKALFTTWHDGICTARAMRCCFATSFTCACAWPDAVMVPVLAALGVTKTGQKQLVGLQLAATEATASWSGLLDRSRAARPAGTAARGHRSARGTQEDVGHVADRPRATLHDAQVAQSGGRVPSPRSAGAETRLPSDHLRDDSGLHARAAYDTFMKKWTTLCPSAARSIEEAGLDLLTFYDFPRRRGSRYARRTRWRISSANSGAGPKRKARSGPRPPPSRCSTAGSRSARSCCAVSMDTSNCRHFSQGNGLRLPKAVKFDGWKMIMVQRLQISSYDPRWVLEFEAERDRLVRALGALACRIDHHGSTAVPGLEAKPIIDIQVSVEQLQPLRVYAEPLATLGYVHVPHADDAVCPFFHRPSEWPHTHHVHVVQSGGHEERRTLAFRDFLREHGDVARDTSPSRNIWRLWSTPRNLRHEKRTRTLRASLSTA